MENDNYYDIEDKCKSIDCVATNLHSVQDFFRLKTVNCMLQASQGIFLKQNEREKKKLWFGVVVLFVCCFWCCSSVAAVYFPFCGAISKEMERKQKGDRRFCCCCCVLVSIWFWLSWSSHRWEPGQMFAFQSIRFICLLLLLFLLQWRCYFLLLVCLSIYFLSFHFLQFTLPLGNFFHFKEFLQQCMPN